MKQRKLSRLLAVVLSVVMLAIPATSVNAAAFSDTEGHWAEEYIDALAAEDIVSGYGTSGAFAPDRNVTRAEAAKMFAVAAGTPSSAVTKFTDLLGDWSDPYIRSLEKAGIVGGVSGSNLFKPKDNIKRSAVAKMAVEAWDITEGDVDVAFNDISHLAEEDQEYINILASNGIVKGYGTTGAFAPDRYVTRAELAKIIYESMNWEPVDNTFRVVDVRAINGVTIEVEFSQPVTETMTDLEDEFTIGTLTLPEPTRSPDGKVLTFVFSSVFTLSNATVEILPIDSEDGLTQSDKYVGKLTYKDTVAPTATVERLSPTQLKIVFSEPVVGGSISATYADGTAITGTILAYAGTVEEVDIDLSASTVTVGKDIKITLNGVADVAGNLINPQPTVLTVVKQQVDGVLPAIVSVTQTGAKTFSIKFNKDLAAAPAFGSVSVDSTAATAVKKISASEYEYTMGAVIETGLKTVSVAANAASDIDGQKNTAALTKVVSFVKDAAAPVATAKLVVGSDNKEKIQLTFDKDVTVGQVTVAGSQVKDFVTTTGISETLTAVYADDTGLNKKVLNIPLEAASLAVEGAAYDLTITSSAVMSDAGLPMVAASAKFTRGKDGSTPSTAVLGAPALSVGDKNNVNVTFPAKVDGASATTVANYSVAGAVIQSVTLMPAVADSSDPAVFTQVAVLNLVPGSNTFSGVRNISVSNVKALGSTKTMLPYTNNTLDLPENVAPVITKAELTAADKITLTFSEVVSNAVGTAGSDFDLYIGGVKSTTKTVTVEVVNVGSEKAALVLTVTGGLTADDLTKGLSLQAATGLDIEDANGNELSVPASVGVTVS